MDERQQFEVEMVVRGYSDFSVDERGKYDGDCCGDLNFAWSVWQARAAQEPRPSGESAASVCQTCGGPVVSSAHGLYCPKPTCKWGWEVEMDGSPLQPPLTAPAQGAEEDADERAVWNYINNHEDMLFRIFGRLEKLEAALASGKEKPSEQTK